MQGLRTEDGKVSINLAPGEKLCAPEGYYQPCKLCGTLYTVLDNREELICFVCDPNGLVRELGLKTDLVDGLIDHMIQKLASDFKHDDYGIRSNMWRIKARMDEIERVIADRASKIRKVG